MKIDLTSKTYRMVFSALMIALATLLSILKPVQLPYGGSITVLSMVPLVLMTQLYRTRWSLFACTVYGVLQLLLGLNNLRGISIFSLVGSVLFDYLIAFAVIGFAGLTCRMKNRPLAAAIGAVIGLTLRYVCHFISGWIFWSESISSWASVAYSLTYNGSFMVPEIIVTAIGAAVVMRLLAKALPEEGVSTL